jgi:hypothetical protein
MIVGILVIELFCRVFFPLGTIPSFDKQMRRVVFLDGRDSIFRNQDDIFTYVPHSDIRNVTGFLFDDEFKIEYDYRFRTNNFGLVQDDDIVPERESLLLLGDSFTEGQGAEPWFRLVSPEVTALGLQAINGGLLGTGFKQWLKLDRYLVASKIRIQKIVVLFISADYIRDVINFKTPELRCLSDLSLCRLEEGMIYRLPPGDELPSWIAKIRTARAPVTRKSWVGARAEALLPATYRVYRYLSDMGERFRRAAIILHSVGAEQQSHDAIGELIRIYGPQNVAFLHVPQKDEVANGGPIKLGLKARRSIEEAGGKVFDGLKLCGLTVPDYYPNDDHPNSAGYVKIASCTNNVIKQLVAGPQ